MASFSFRSRKPWAYALLALALPVVACSVSQSGPKSLQTSGHGGTSASSTGPGSGGLPPGVGGSPPVVSFVGSGGSDTSDASDDAHMSVCTDAGCTCVRIASIGHEGVWGPCSSDSTTALQSWLNTQSTAKVDNYDTTKPTLTPAFLAQYDVLLLQWMVETGMQNNDGAAWVFTADEVSALEAWVKAGGGLIVLSGYQCPGNGCTIYDTIAPNQLLSFTDISFNSDDVMDPAKTSCQDCYCWGGSLPVGGPLPNPEGGTWPASDAPTPGPWDQTSPIGQHLSSVGAYVARSIKSTTASVDSTDGTNVFAVHETIGKGHVFVYGDEWVTYSGEWLGTAKCLNASMFTNMYDPCYEKSAAQVFQIPQFWYNAIKYAASSVQCFTIMQPGIVQTN